MRGQRKIVFRWQFFIEKYIFKNVYFIAMWPQFLLIIFLTSEKANLYGVVINVKKDKLKNFIKFLLVIIIYSYKKKFVFQLTHMPQ